ncbi:MAG: hypothetical protein M3Q00_11430 [Pseudomonadota bacterium]|nr:hypothetical protein [Pseudomonadota bacterium]
MTFRSSIACFALSVLIQAPAISIAADYDLNSIQAAGEEGAPTATLADEPAMAPPIDAAAAEEDSRKFWERWGFSGSARAAYWSSSRLLDNEKNLGVGALWLKWNHRLPKGIGLYAEGWARSDNVFKGTDKKYLMREAYADYATDSWDFRLGRQIIAWGRADRVNPTDNLTPRNFNILVAEDDDNRFGALAAKARLNFSDYSLTGIWLPDFRANVLPFFNQTGISFEEHVPDSNRSWATKFERSGKDLDWSVSYYDGFDLNPDISVQSAGPAGVTLLLSHHRYRVLGADAATTVGRLGFRGEIAYARTADSNGADPFIKNPFFWGVVGVERTFFSYLNVNLQYFLRHVTKFEDPSNVANPALKEVALIQAVVSNQRDRVQHGVTFRISNKWMNETLEGEVAGIWDFTRNGYFLRPKVIYAINDKWKAVAGFDYYGGPDDSFFGRLKDNRGAFAELIYGF